jgi:hypothetical protein
MDYKLIPELWPDLFANYVERFPRLQPGVSSPRTVTGADTAPYYVFVPAPRDP